MAINTNVNFFLELHEGNVNCNRTIDDIKKELKKGQTTSSQGKNYFDLLSRFNQALASFESSKSSLPQECKGRVDVVNSAFERTRMRMEKLGKKFAPIAPAPTTSSTSAQMISQRASSQKLIAFYDDKTDALTGCFGNFHECQLEFGGMYYKNSESVFQALKFTDQPLVMAKFQNTTGDMAVSLGKQKMTPTRLADWDNLQKPNVNKVDVMMNVLRAKFGQNPSLKEMLMATGSAYLVEHLPDANRSDRFWSDGFDGTGLNQLGICLMKLRQEYGGMGEVAKPIANQSLPTSSLSGKCIYCKTNDKYYDAVTRKLYDCCSVDCTNRAAAQSSSPSPSLQGRCIQCNTRSKFTDVSGRVHDYCGLSCAKAAGVKK